MRANGWHCAEAAVPTFTLAAAAPTPRSALPPQRAAESKAAMPGKYRTRFSRNSIEG